MTYDKEAMLGIRKEVSNKLSNFVSLSSLVSPTFLNYEEISRKESNISPNKSKLNINVYYNNCRSLKNKLNHLHILLKHQKFHILIFSETWLSPDYDDKLLLLDHPYYLLRSDRENKKGGGVCIFIKNNIIAVPKLIMTKRDISIISCDITVDQPDSSENLSIQRILVVYSPPHMSTTMDDINFTLSNIADNCITENPIMVIGDFNISNTNISTEFTDFMGNLSLTQLINFPTRHSNHLDLLFASNSSHIKNIQKNEPLGNSDHASITFQLQIPDFTKNYITYMRGLFDFNRGNYEGLNKYLANISWITEFKKSADTGIDAIYSKFTDLVHHGMNCFIPKKNVINKVDKYPVHIRKIIQYRDKLTKNIKFQSVKIKHDICTAKLQMEVNKFRINCENKIIKKGPTEIFKHVSRHLFPKQGLVSLIKDDLTYDKPQDLAPIFLEHFSNIFLTRHDCLDLDNREIEGKFDYNLIFIENATIFKILSELNPSANSSPDGIPFIVLKNCAVSLALPVSIILRRSFFFGTVPRIWKTAIVIPVPKKKNNKCTNVTEYRPISLTCSLARIAEKLVYTEVLGFLKNIEAIPIFQHGFIKRKSVYSNLLETLDDWTRMIDAKMCVDVVYIDLKSAFDRVNQPRLFSKLELLGFTGDIMKWLKSFLSNRFFQVRVNNFLSKLSQEINSGVAQGTVLGPLMFNIFVADILGNWEDESVKIKMYADDIKSYVSFSAGDKEPINKLQKFIDFLMDWCAVNGLNISIDKCCVMHLGVKNPGHNYTIGNQFLHQVKDNVRDLGLYITPNLKWEQHVKKKCKIAYFKWFSIFRFFKTHNPVVLVRLYKAYVRPVLEFGSIFYNNSSVTVRDTLERVQRRITRMIVTRCFSRKYIVPPAYHIRLGLLSLESLEFRRHVLDLTMFHKIDKNILALDPSNKPSFTINKRTRGPVWRYDYGHCRLEVRRKYYLICTPKIYNKLPTKMTDIKCPATFLRTIKKDVAFILNNFSPKFHR